MADRIALIPELLRQKVVTLGDEGLRWLADLENLIKDLEQEWQISVGLPLAGGSEAYVAPTTARDGSKAILKIAMPPAPGNTILVNEVTALRIADGRGYVRLLRFDPGRRALLLEPLGLTLADLGYSSQAQIEIICTTLKNSWFPLPAEAGLPSGASMAQWFSEFILNLWNRLDRPCSPQALETALSFAQAREKAFDLTEAVLLHGDATNRNILQAGESEYTFKFIDPDGIAGEPAYDLGVLMREWLDELTADPLKLGRERCNYLSELCGVAPEPIWQWGFMQAMCTGLLLLQIGQQQPGRQMLAIAEAWTVV